MDHNCPKYRYIQTNVYTYSKLYIYYLGVTIACIYIIKHARKSLLFNNGKPWIKNNNGNLFDFTMGSYDGREFVNW